MRSMINFLINFLPRLLLFYQNALHDKLRETRKRQRGFYCAFWGLVRLSYHARVSRQEEEETATRMLLQMHLPYYYTVRFRRMETPLMETVLGICLSLSQKHGNSLAWVRAAVTVYFTYPVLYRFSAESRAGEWEL